MDSGLAARDVVWSEVRCRWRRTRQYQTAAALVCVLGSPRAINAGAYKLARFTYRMLKTGHAYEELGADHYDRRYKDRVLANLQRRAAELGFRLAPDGAVVSKKTSRMLLLV